MISSLANVNVPVILSEGGIWKRIFGLDAQTLFDTAVTLIAMLVLFMLLSYLLFNPARELIKKRREFIENDMEEARKDKEQAAIYKEEYDSRLKNIQSEADEIMSSTRKKAQKQETEIVNEAKEEAGRIIKRAEKEAELEKNKARDEIKQEIISVATLMAGKMINVSIDEATQNELIDTTLKEMGDKTWQN